jgi:hypothetical protein
VFFRGGAAYICKQNIQPIETKINFLKEVFPEELLNSFQITSYELLGDVATRSDFYSVQIDEQNILPPGVSLSTHESKGFDTSKKIQDFPIRGKAVYLFIRIRLWRHKETGKISKNNYGYIAKGAKLTKELSDFLKYASQYED